MLRTPETCKYCEYGKYNELTGNYSICNYPYDDDPLMNECLNAEKNRRENDNNIRIKRT